MDDGVAQVLAALKAIGQLNNTPPIFISDSGISGASIAKSASGVPTKWRTSPTSPNTLRCRRNWRDRWQRSGPGVP